VNRVGEDNSSSRRVQMELHGLKRELEPELRTLIAKPQRLLWIEQKIGSVKRYKPQFLFHDSEFHFQALNLHQSAGVHIQ